jgi:hypothetical protein
MIRNYNLYKIIFKPEPVFWPILDTASQNSTKHLYDDGPADHIENPLVISLLLLPLFYFIIFIQENRKKNSQQNSQRAFLKVFVLI